MPTIVPTGPLDPNYHRDQADRLARTMALFIADKRRRKESELEKRRARVQQLYEATARGQLPPDSANLEAAIQAYEELDPQGAGDIRTGMQQLFNQQGYLKEYNRKLMAASAGGVDANLAAIMRSLPEPAQDWLLESGKITPEMLFKPKPNRREPTSAADAQMMVITGEMTPEEGSKAVAIFTKQAEEEQLRKYADQEAEDRLAEQKIERARVQGRTEYSWRLTEADKHEKATVTKPERPEAETLAIDPEKYAGLVKTFATQIKDQQPPDPGRGAAAKDKPKPIPETRIYGQARLRAAAVKVAKLNGPAIGFSPEWAAGLSDLIRKRYENAMATGTEVEEADKVEAELRSLGIFVG